MLYISHLEILFLRNIEKIAFDPSQSFNVFFGENGSGKTSILEAIYILGTSKSFRHHISNRLVNYEKNKLSISGLLNHQISLNVEKWQTGKTSITFQSDTKATPAELAMHMPLKLINPDSHRLLDEGSKSRRKFLDWGVFHVEQSFFSLWARLMKALKQRNICLKEKLSDSEITAWNSEIIYCGNELDRLRQQYCNYFFVYFNKFITHVLPEYQDLKLEYVRGWPSDEDLDRSLIKSLARDKILGYTSLGAHRADLLIKVNERKAIDVLSRGQQKLLVAALNLAQGVFLKEFKHKDCIYLVDDLPAELDPHKRTSLIGLLQDIQCQIFLTTVDPAIVEQISDKSLKMFHVKQGNLIPTKA